MHSLTFGQIKVPPPNEVQLKDVLLNKNVKHSYLPPKNERITLQDKLQSHVEL